MKYRLILVFALLGILCGCAPFSTKACPAIYIARPTSPMLASGDMLFFSTWDGSVFALDAASGKVRWHSRALLPTTSTNVPSAPVVMGDQLFFNAGQEVVALSVNDGSQLWSYRPPTDARATGRVGSAVVVGTTVYVPTDDALYALGTQDGQKRWQVIGHFTGVAATAKAVYAVSANTWGAYDTVTGAHIWQVASTFSGGTAHPPLLAGAQVIIKQNNILLALNQQTGAVLWKIFANSEPAIDGTTLYLEDGEPTQADDVEAISAEDGHVIWSTPVAYRPSFLSSDHTLSAPGITNEMVFIYDYNGVQALDRQTGGLRWQKPESGYGVVFPSSPIANGTQLVLGPTEFFLDCSNHTSAMVGALRVNDGSPLWTVTIRGNDVSG